MTLAERTTSGVWGLIPDSESTELRRRTTVVSKKEEGHLKSPVSFKVIARKEDEIPRGSLKTFNEGYQKSKSFSSRSQGVFGKKEEYFNVDTVFKSPSVEEETNNEFSMLLGERTDDDNEEIEDEAKLTVIQRTIGRPFYQHDPPQERLSSINKESKKYSHQSVDKNSSSIDVRTTSSQTLIAIETSSMISDQFEVSSEGTLVEGLLEEWNSLRIENSERLSPMASNKDAAEESMGGSYIPEFTQGEHGQSIEGHEAIINTSYPSRRQTSSFVPHKLSGETSLSGEQDDKGQSRLYSKIRTSVEPAVISSKKNSATYEQSLERKRLTSERFMENEDRRFRRKSGQADKINSREIEMTYQVSMDSLRYSKSQTEPPPNSIDPVPERVGLSRVQSERIYKEPENRESSLKSRNVSFQETRRSMKESLVRNSAFNPKPNTSREEDYFPTRMNRGLSSTRNSIPVMFQEAKSTMKRSLTDDRHTISKDGRKVSDLQFPYYSNSKKYPVLNRQSLGNRSDFDEEKEISERCDNSQRFSRLKSPQQPRFFSKRIKHEKDPSMIIEWLESGRFQSHSNLDRKNTRFVSKVWENIKSLSGLSGAKSTGRPQYELVAMHYGEREGEKQKTIGTHFWDKIRFWKRDEGTKDQYLSSSSSSDIFEEVPENNEKTQETEKVSFINFVHRPTPADEVYEMFQVTGNL